MIEHILTLSMYGERTTSALVSDYQSGLPRIKAGGMIQGLWPCRRRPHAVICVQISSEYESTKRPT